MTIRLTFLGDYTARALITPSRLARILGADEQSVFAMRGRQFNADHFDWYRWRSCSDHPQQLSGRLQRKLEAARVRCRDQADRAKRGAR